MCWRANGAALPGQPALKPGARAKNTTGSRMTPGHTNYYIAAAALALGLIIVGITRWIEHRREKNPMPRLVPTTPFMAVGILIVIGATAFSLALWRETPAANSDV